MSFDHLKMPAAIFAVVALPLIGGCAGTPEPQAHAAQRPMHEVKSSDGKHMNQYSQEKDAKLGRFRIYAGNTLVQQGISVGGIQEPFDKTPGIFVITNQCQGLNQVQFINNGKNQVVIDYPDTLECPTAEK